MDVIRIGGEALMGPYQGFLGLGLFIFQGSVKQAKDFFFFFWGGGMREQGV